MVSSQRLPISYWNLGIRMIWRDSDHLTLDIWCPREVVLLNVILRPVAKASPETCYKFSHPAPDWLNQQFWWVEPCNLCDCAAPKVRKPLLSKEPSPGRSPCLPRLLKNMPGTNLLLSTKPPYVFTALLQRILNHGKRYQDEIKHSIQKIKKRGQSEA